MKQQFKLNADALLLPKLPEDELFWKSLKNATATTKTKPRDV